MRAINFIKSSFVVELDLMEILTRWSSERFLRESHEGTLKYFFMTHSASFVGLCNAGPINSYRLQFIVTVRNDSADSRHAR